jgi:hypothetical protein
VCESFLTCNLAQRIWLWPSSPSIVSALLSPEIPSYRPFWNTKICQINFGLKSYLFLWDIEANMTAMTNASPQQILGQWVILIFSGQKY